ncbi:prephenate dehydrogenase domain protein [Leptospira interrogans serovar Australis str. 200703203]|uniref:Prephenate dehydrogenase domain protein n=1 Tax=Leptospira interrogans serovar Australis str. 200703203 TaxID=1085541 RepID=N1UIS4_LEPIR|nr:prephenate dehydrogenase domain protein [Leptospira interrogans serovar Australis str. 200703203]
MKLEFSNILIYGLGLMGASLSLALKQKGTSASITGVVGSTKSKIKGQSLKSADQILTSEEFRSTQSWKDYDFIIFGVPVDLTVKLISELPTDFSGIITDLGSTKKKSFMRWRPIFHLDTIIFLLIRCVVQRNLDLNSQTRRYMKDDFVF